MEEEIERSEVRANILEVLTDSGRTWMVVYKGLRDLGWVWELVVLRAPRFRQRRSFHVGRFLGVERNNAHHINTASSISEASALNLIMDSPQPVH